MPIQDGEQGCKIIFSIFKTDSFDDAEPHMVQNGVPCGSRKFCILGKLAETSFFSRLQTSVQNLTP